MNKTSMFGQTGIALAVLVSLLSSACMENSSSELFAIEAEMERATLAVMGLHSFVTDSGRYKYEFETPQLEQYDNEEEPYTNFPAGLTFKMYDATGTTVSSRIKCNNAKYYKPRNLWELNYDVEALTQKGDILNTEQMFWDAENHKIYSDKFVKITTKGQMITGRGFESDEDMSWYEIKHPGGEIETVAN